MPGNKGQKLLQYGKLEARSFTEVREHFPGQTLLLAGQGRAVFLAPL